MKYIDADRRRENDEAKRQGVPVPRIAELRHMEVSELCCLMGWPQWIPEPVTSQADTTFDLFRTDELDGVL